MSEVISQWRPSHYNKHALVQYELSLGMIESFNIQRHETILDVGCGDGRITHELALRADQGLVVGVDRTREMIDFARQQWRDISSLSFQHQDATELNLEQQFDRVTSFNCLHWIRELPKALAGISRTLKSGGSFAGLVYPRCENLWIPAEELETSPRWSDAFQGFINPYEFDDADGYRAKLEQAGFCGIEMVQETKRREFSCPQEFISYMLSWLPHPAQVDDPESFMADWLARYQALTGQTDDYVYMDYQVLTFICQKSSSIDEC
ncbi:class I SAM-dependent methyltransferase [Dongshaea marina]|uniref:class I SAM-dependent methyltransferase n=1 Tax=Dongshaea marina TaxID=2047966 RepID=UPI000D3E9159|nr:class I SAM-dependent methyltransferase [Dongshaea marina]